MLAQASFSDVELGDFIRWPFGCVDAKVADRVEHGVRQSVQDDSLICRWVNRQPSDALEPIIAQLDQFFQQSRAGHRVNTSLPFFRRVIIFAPVLFLFF